MYSTFQHKWAMYPRPRPPLRNRKLGHVSGPRARVSAASEGVWCRHNCGQWRALFCGLLHLPHKSTAGVWCYSKNFHHGWDFIFKSCCPYDSTGNPLKVRWGRIAPACVVIVPGLVTGSISIINPLLWHSLAGLVPASPDQTAPSPRTRENRRLPRSFNTPLTSSDYQPLCLWSFNQPPNIAGTVSLPPCPSKCKLSSWRSQKV